MKKVIIAVLATAMIIFAGFCTLCACSGHTTTIEILEHSYCME